MLNASLVGMQHKRSASLARMGFAAFDLDIAMLCFRSLIRRSASGKAS